MLWTAVLFFLLAAVLGLIILTAVLKNNPTPKSAVFTHGPLAAIGLIIVIIYAIQGHSEPILIGSVVLFLLAAVGGLTMFTFDMSKKPIPKIIAIIHPLVAVTALGMLLVYILQL